MHKSSDKNSLADDEDATSSYDEEVALAKKLLDHRSSLPTLNPKGGAKYCGYNGTVDEANRLHAYHIAQNNVLSSWKVRKLANLGMAEWLPDLCVAKVVKQGKFMQTKSHSHEKGFFALFPEEALFLLDVGDIELTYKGALLSLQDAYCLLLCSSPDGQLCSVDEYHVYAHLSRMGFRVQRFSTAIITYNETIQECSSSSTEKTKRKVHLESPKSQESKHKKPKLTHNNYRPLKHVSEVDILCHEGDNLSRNWWIPQTDNEDCHKLNSHTAVNSETNGELSKTDFPNLADSSMPLVLKEQDASLLPSQTTSHNCDVDRIWNQRLKRDDRQANVILKKDYSHVEDIDYGHICRTARNWTHYNIMVEVAKQEKVSEMKSLCDTMHGGDVVPLVHPNSAHSTASVLDRLKIMNEYKNEFNQSKLKPTQFQIRFNVFQTDTMKPFRKTQPGKPYLRIVVSNSHKTFPSLADITQILSESDGVPVKIALADFGRVVFFAFDDISIPTEVNKG